MREDAVLSRGDDGGMHGVKAVRRAFAVIFLSYVLLAVVFFFVAGDQLHTKTVLTDDMVSPEGILGEIIKGDIVDQAFRIDASSIDSVTLKLFTYDRANTSTLDVSIRKGNEILAQERVQAAAVQNNEKLTVFFSQAAVAVPGEKLLLRLESQDAVPGNALTVYYGSSVSLRAGSVERDLSETGRAYVNGDEIQGSLCYQASGIKELWFGPRYWQLFIAGAILIAAAGVSAGARQKAGKSLYLLALTENLKRYRFLIRQLVHRDFKSKYKRSVLGVLWSFLNPLLTMAVQYIVFSTLFRSNIDNFILYLLTGIVCFSFFSETTNLSLTSIVGNASLITKVYVPKYIFPLTRVLSSSINLLLSMIPLFAVMIVTGTPLTIAVLLLPFGFACLFLFCLGMSFLLSSSMVFFRDTQFLWGILSTLWMYLTPIFYPETIIPARFMTLYKLNPLYHVVRFFRSILMYGLSPEPKAYLLCFIASVVPLVLGVLVFKLTQDRFVTNL